MKNLAALAPSTEFVVQQSRHGRAVALPPNAKVVASPEEATARGIDAAVIATASAEHADALRHLIPASVPLYVEKPVLTSEIDAAEISQLMREVGYDAPSLVGCNLRYLPSLIKTRELITSGAVGRIVRAHLEAGQWLPDWRPERDYRASYSASSEAGGGVVLDLIHELDVARWMLGEFDRVQADLAQRSSLEIDSEDTAGILLSQRGGALAVVALDYVSRRPVRRYCFTGEEGTIVWDMPSKQLVITRATGIEQIRLDDDAFDVSTTYMRAMSEFLRAIDSGLQTSQPLSEGLSTLALALRAKKAAL